MPRILLILCALFLSKFSFSQCVSTINTFPYNESFEGGTAGWVSGGVSSDWAWGTPSKGFIQNAGAGTKCWVTGGLNGSFYNLGQRSYVTSPCFDFTNLQYPHIKMKIYWEGENQYDGTTFQFSLNNGLTWDNVGTNTDPVDCLNENWFNQSNINALNTLANPKHGWAGTVQPTQGTCFGGNGSAGWVTAQHCMNNLAGQPSVMFRFAFGAGTVCNDFDGFAFDDIQISNAPANNADFAFSCTMNSLEYQFTNTSAFCPTNFSWNFGDPLSGPSNTSNVSNPTHQFSSPGTYNVTLTVAGPCNQSSTITKTITTLNSSVSLSNPSCFNQNNGSIGVNVTGNNGVPNFTLQPGNLSNSSGLFNTLSAGNYTVTCVDAAGCSITETAQILNPAAINWTSYQSTTISCNGAQDGQIAATASGGTGILTYNIQPGNINNTSGIFSSLGPATYTITVSDNNNCSISTTTLLIQPSTLLITNLASTNLTCFNSNDGNIQITASGGTPGLSYTLNPGAQSNTSGLFNNLPAGMYTINVVDSKGCSTVSTVNISNAPVLNLVSVSITQPSCVPGNDGTLNVLASGGNGNLQYSIGGVFTSNTMFNSLTANNYTITIKDANNCTITTTANLQNPNVPIITNITTKNASCYGLKDGSLSVVATGTSPIVEYLLQPSNQTNNNGLYTNLGADIYTISVKDANGCSVTTTQEIIQPSALQILESNYLAHPCGSEYVGSIKFISTGGTGTILYQLSNGNTNQTGEFNFKNVGNYSLTVTDANNCQLDIAFSIPESICCGNIIVPNAFSPNYDGRNDELRLINASGIELKNFIVYNRWGQRVFEAQHIDDRWDGKYKGVEAEAGSYFFLVEYKCLGDNKAYKLKGDVILIR